MIHHVALETRPADVDACVAFLALLGFARVPEPAGLRGAAVWVERAGQQVHLQLDDAPTVPPRGHLAVVADDYDATLGRLRAAGHAVEERAPHWGSPRCFATDPAGHRVEVMAFAPR